MKLQSHRVESGFLWPAYCLCYSEVNRKASNRPVGNYIQYILAHVKFPFEFADQGNQDELTADMAWVCKHQETDRNCQPSEHLKSNKVIKCLANPRPLLDGLVA